MVLYLHKILTKRRVVTVHSQTNKKQMTCLFAIFSKCHIYPRQAERFPLFLACGYDVGRLYSPAHFRLFKTPFLFYCVQFVWAKLVACKWPCCSHFTVCQPSTATNGHTWTISDSHGRVLNVSRYLSRNYEVTSWISRWHWRARMRWKSSLGWTVVTSPDHG
jgi:hypothetical protein